MDLLRTMIENRKASGIPSNHVPTLGSLPTPAAVSLKQEIIEKKPKSHKKLKEHFEAIIERYCVESDSEED